MKPDVPLRFVQAAVNLLEVGAEITDSAIDDYAIGVVQGNDGLKQYLADRLAKLIGAPNTAMTVDDEMTVACQAAAIDPAKLLGLLQLLLSLWGQFQKRDAE